MSVLGDKIGGSDPMGAWRAVCDGNPTPMLPRLVDLFLPRADVCCWHLATFCCGANVWTLLEVKRTLRARRGRVDLKRLTHSRHQPVSFAAVHGAR